MSLPDLNLLVTLDVLLVEGSVARAARRLRLSPSAMSRALARLRETMGDPLLVSLSGILCLRHSMTNRSIYAKQEEVGGSRHDGVAVDPQGTH
jgi:hypothetical protein